MISILFLRLSKSLFFLHPCLFPSESFSTNVNISLSLLCILYLVLFNYVRTFAFPPSLHVPSFTPSRPLLHPFTPPSACACEGGASRLKNLVLKYDRVVNMLDTVIAVTEWGKGKKGKKTSRTRRKTSTRRIKHSVNKSPLI